MSDLLPSEGDRVRIDFGDDAADHRRWKDLEGTVAEVVPGVALGVYVEFDRPYGRNGHHQTGGWFPVSAVHDV